MVEAFQSVVMRLALCGLAVLAAAMSFMQSPVPAQRQPFRPGMTVRSSEAGAMIYEVCHTPNTALPILSRSSSNPG